MKGDRELLLEVKKRALEVVAFRNRGIATTAPAGGSDPIVAKAGTKLPRGADASEFMLDLYLRRDYETRVPRRDLISLRDQMLLGADLVAVLRQPRVNLDPDMKRRLVNAREVEIRHGPFAGRRHLATDSEPFDTVDDLVSERVAFEAWRHERKRVLKTKGDWDDWRDFRASSVARKRAGGKVRVTGGGAADVLKRQFLRALVRGRWGLSLGQRAHADVAAWLTVRGFPTTVNEVKNASRAANEPTPHVVAAVEGSLKLLRVLQAEFPELHAETFFAVQDAAAVADAVARWAAAAAR